jgi:hypothetical protein
MSTSAEGSVNGKYEARSRIDRFCSKKASMKSMQRRLQIGEAHALIDEQPLDLMKHRRVAGIGIDAIDAPGRNQCHRRLLRLHGADLHRRGMGAQQMTVLEIERVMQRARRMIRPECSALRSCRTRLRSPGRGPPETRAPEDLLDAQARERDRMQAAQVSPRPGSVTSMARRAARPRRALLELGAARFDPACSRCLALLMRAPAAGRSAAAARPAP